jgi:tRNA(Ile)-lysidine synthetase-like protein
MDHLRLLEPASNRPRLVIAHLNHGLRGAQSDQDQAFVGELANQKNLEVFSQKLQGSAPSTGEAPLRTARISFLKGIAYHIGASWIATGATADDSVETMLHNLLRGTGPAGLAGIRHQREISKGVQLIHPMLGLWKSDLLEYLGSIGQSFCIDESNSQNLYTRNRIRNECLPFLERFIESDQLKQRLLKTSELIRQEHQVIEQLALQWLDSKALWSHFGIAWVGRFSKSGIGIGNRFDRGSMPQQDRRTRPGCNCLARSSFASLARSFASYHACELCIARCLRQFSLSILG